MESEALSKLRDSFTLIASNAMPQRASSFGKAHAGIFRAARDGLLQPTFMEMFLNQECNVESEGSLNIDERNL